MKKLLITGASGLLGKAVLKQLKGQREYEVYAVTRAGGHLKNHTDIHVIECDLCIETQREHLMESIRPNVLLHLAWNQEEDSFRMSNTNLLWLNISISLLYLFEQYGGKRFLFAGSSSEYDGSEGVFNERADILPASLYGLCKKAFNEFAVEYCKRAGIKYVGMRFFTIYGAGDSHDFGAIPTAIRMLLRNEELICNSPDTTRDYIYAADAASVILQLIDHSFTGIVNVASGNPRSMREVFQCIGNIMGKAQYVKMAEKPSDLKRFEADIHLLKQLGIFGYCSNFEMNVKEMLQKNEA